MHNEGFVSLYLLPQDHVIRMGNGFDAKLLQIRISGCITGVALVWVFILCVTIARVCVWLVIRL